MYNHVETHDNRLWPSIKDEFYFLKIQKGPVWVSEIYKTYHETSYTGEEPFNLEKNDILFSTYFFLSNAKTMHFRKTYNLVDLLSELGGM